MRRQDHVGLLLWFLLAIGCGAGPGTGLLVLRVSADRSDPPTQGSRIVLIGTGNIRRTSDALFPPSGGGPLLVQYPDLPAGPSGIDLGIEILDARACVVGESPAPIHVVIKGGAKTTADIVVRRSSRACDDAGMPPPGLDGGTREATLYEAQPADIVDGAAPADRPTAEIVSRTDTSFDTQSTDLASWPGDVAEDRPLSVEDLAPDSASWPGDVAEDRPLSVEDLAPDTITMDSRSNRREDTIVEDTGGAGAGGNASGGMTTGGTGGTGGVGGTTGTTAIDCRPPARPLNGTVEAASTTLGATASYACSVGYGLAGAATRTCKADGAWSGAVPTCVLVDCGAPSIPSKGSVSLSADTLYQSVATYACIAGYRIAGNRERACQADGTWSGVSPTCEAVDCGALTPPVNGSVSGSATYPRYQSVATYSCSSAFVLSGSATRTCQPNGTWSESAPTCICSDGTKTVCGAACVDTSTDLNNCGGCGTVCSTTSPSTAQCIDKRCLVTLAAGTDVCRFTLDDDNVYWTYGCDENPNHWMGGVNRVAKAGGTVNTLAGRLPTAIGIAVVSGTLYWTLGCGYGDGTSIRSLSLSDGATGVVTSSSAMGCWVDLAVDTASVFWNENSGGRLWRLPRGSQVASLISSSAQDFAIDNSHVYWTQPPASGEDVGFIRKMPLAGGEVVTLVSSQEMNPASIAVDGSSVYWITYEGAIKKIAKAGGETILLAPGRSESGLCGPSLVSDGKNVYFGGEDQTLLRVSVNGGGVTQLATTLPCGPHRIVVDSTSVYWNGGDLMKLTPK